MRSRLIRPLLAIEFLVAIDVCFTFWSEVGGQYDLDLMFWPWKFGLTLAAAGLITAITAELVRGGLSRRMVIYGALLLAVVVTAGIVTYYYYMNEPADDNGDAPASQTTRLQLPPSRRLPGRSPAQAEACPTKPIELTTRLCMPSPAPWAVQRNS